MRKKAAVRQSAGARFLKREFTPRLPPAGVAVHRLARMQASAATPPRLKPGPLGAIALFLFSLAWRLPYSLTRPITHIDENWFSLPTVRRMLAGDWLLYVSGTDYGAPIQEACSALLARLFGENLLTFRLPAVLFGAAAVVMAYGVLREVVKERAAFALALLLALPNSAVGRYTTYAHSTYAALLLLLGMIQWMTFRTDRERTMRNWLVLAALMGTSSYFLRLSLMQTGPLLLWLGLRSDFFRRFREGLREPAVRRCAVRAVAVLSAAGLALAPVLYRFLTRRETYAMSRPELALTGLALLLGRAGLWLARPALPGARRPEWLAAIFVAAGLVFIPLPAKVWFQRVEAPKLAARQVKLWGEVSYNLKHLHEMPHQARLLVQGIGPAILIGRWDELEGYPLETEPLTWKCGITLAFVGLFGVVGLWRWRRGWRPEFWGRDFVLISPFITVIVVMFPSWSLHSETCYRYLGPFLAGFYLLAYRVIQPAIERHPRLTCAALAALILQNAFDCFWHMP